MEDDGHGVACAGQGGGDLAVALLEQLTAVRIEDLDIIAVALAPKVRICALLDVHAGEGELNGLALSHHQRVGHVLVHRVVEGMVGGLNSSACTTFAITTRASPGR